MEKNPGHASPAAAGYTAIPLAACLLVSGCSSLPKGELALDLGIKDRGVASWYGKDFHGKLAANGEVFDRNALTAAHRKLPLGSIARVLNLENGKSVHVRITDRGPYVIGRMLDLSQAAARALEMVAMGTAAVQIEVIGEPRGLTLVPHRQWSSVGGMLLSRGSCPIRRWSNQAEEISTVTVGIRSHENLYVRRERWTGGLLAET